MRKSNNQPADAVAAQNETSPSGPVYKRAGFFLRICTHIFDIAIAITALTVLVKSPNGIAMILTIWAYYFFCDVAFGRTIGKIFSGLYYLTKDQRPLAKGALTPRAFYRFLLVLGVLSWNKTTLIDLLTGIRVYVIVPPPKNLKVKSQSRRRLKPTR